MSSHQCETIRQACFFRPPHYDCVARFLDIGVDQDIDKFLEYALFSIRDYPLFKEMSSRGYRFNDHLKKPVHLECDIFGLYGFDSWIHFLFHKLDSSLCMNLILKAPVTVDFWYDNIVTIFNSGFIVDDFVTDIIEQVVTPCVRKICYEATGGGCCTKAAKTK